MVLLKNVTEAFGIATLIDPTSVPELGDEIETLQSDPINASFTDGNKGLPLLRGGSL